MRSLLASLRIANAPSAVSNVFLGYFLALFLHLKSSSETMEFVGQIPVLILLALLSLCLLFAGNLLNDWHDREWDAEHRPERALPSGKFSPSSYRNAALALFGIAILAAALLSWQVILVTLLIIGLIVHYTYYHKASSSGIFTMAGCRAGLYLLGYFAIVSTTIHWTALLLHAAALYSYMVALSLNARYESLASPPRKLLIGARFLLILPPLILSIYWLPSPFRTIFLVSSMVYLAWILRSIFSGYTLPRFVSTLLAGIPLIDLMAATAIAAALPSPMSTLAYAFPMTAIIFALLLQGLAPAT